ncbi:MAG: RsmE family RNA methyltransferase [Symbiopectobacterium sp.]
MRIPRFSPRDRAAYRGDIELSEDAANHVGHILRMNPGDALQLFDDSNHVLPPRSCRSEVKSRLSSARSPVVSRTKSHRSIFDQVMSRGEKMEFIVQKSIEIGVNVITPLFSEHCGVKLDGKRLKKKSRSGKNCHRRLRAVWSKPDS